MPRYCVAVMNYAGDTQVRVFVPNEGLFRRYHYSLPKYPLLISLSCSIHSLPRISSFGVPKRMRSSTSHFLDRIPNG